MPLIVRPLPNPCQTMASCTIRNFDITILGSEPPYPIIAGYEQRTANGFFTQDAFQPAWIETMQVLAQTHTPPQEMLILNVGATLFSEVVQGPIRDLWVEARAELGRGNHHLRVRLNLQPPAVAALPWETLADPGRRTTLAADRSLALVRTATDVEFVGQSRPLESRLPARILIAAVEDPQNIDAAGEIERIRAALGPLIPERVQIDTLSGRFGIHQLLERMQDFRPDILHIISHGEADGLYLWGQEDLTLTSASQLAAALNLVESVKFVFLNACLAGQPDNAVPYASLAQRLLQIGIPAVIAMQFEVRDRAAADFAGFLYRALVDGPCPGSIDVAVSIARSGLYISDPDRIDYATPLLWLNAPDGLILKLDEETDAPVPSRVDAPPTGVGASVPPPRLSLEIDEKERWFAGIPAAIRPPALRFDYAERRKLLEKVLDALRQDASHVETGQPFDYRQVSERLEIFETERRKLDAILARLDQPEE